MKQNESKGITMAKQLTLSDQSLALIKKLLEEKTTMNIRKDSQSPNQAGDESYSKRHSNVWVSFKQLQLNQDDKRMTNIYLWHGI